MQYDKDKNRSNNLCQKRELIAHLQSPRKCLLTIGKNPEFQFKYKTTNNLALCQGIELYYPCINLSFTV
jgi:hypothetical protein